MTGAPSLVICGARVIDGHGGPPLENHDVRIDAGRITGVTPCHDTVVNGLPVVEAAGTTLLPGLVNMHVHLRGDRMQDLSDADDIGLLRASQNARRSLSWGVTTVRDAGASHRLSQTIRDAIAAGVIAGPRVLSAGRIITTSAGHGWRSGLRADNADELRKAVRRSVEDGVDTIKIAATGGGGTPGSNVGAAQYSADELAAAVAEAHRLGKRVLAHCNGTAGTRNAVAAGVDTVEHIGWMGADGRLEYDERVVAAMIEKDITVVPTMAVWFRPGYDEIETLSADQKKMRAARPARTAAWAAMFRAGVRFATGTDTWDPISRELALMVGEMGLAPMQAIVAATRDAAVGLGLAREIGTIEPGKVADLVQLRRDPLADIGALGEVERVWRAGALVVEGGRVLG